MSSPSLENLSREELIALLKQKEQDKRKREYAALHNIPLLEIWYYDIDKIDDILDDYLKLRKVS